MIFNADEFKWKPTLLQILIFPFLKTYKASATTDNFKSTIYAKHYKGKVYIIKEKFERTSENE